MSHTEINFNVDAVRRLTRCDADGVPKLVQFIEYRQGTHGFFVTLYNGQKRFISAGIFGIGRRALTNRDYRKVEKLFAILANPRARVATAKLPDRVNLGLRSTT